MSAFSAQTLTSSNSSTPPVARTAMAFMVAVSVAIFRGCGVDFVGGFGAVGEVRIAENRHGGIGDQWVTIMG